MKRKVTWDEIDNIIHLLALRIKDKGFKPTKVLGIPRGGTLLSIILSHQLNIPYIERGGEVKKEDVLLIMDDISDSGHTMQKYYNIYAPNVITATIHLRPGSKFIPDFYYEITEDWLIYPWETIETSKADYLEKE